MKHNLNDEQIDGLMARIISLQNELDLIKKQAAKYREALINITFIKGSPPYSVASKIAEKALE